MKKYLSLILAMSFLLQSFFLGTSFAEERIEYNENEVLLLQILDIIDFDISNADALNAKVTRGEFCVSAAKSMGITGKTQVPKTRYFKDVSPMERSAEYIHALYERGIVNGTGEGEFRPNEYILPMDAVTIMLRVAGYNKIYTNEAEMNKISSRYGLADGLGGEYMTNGQAAELIYKVLLMPVPVLNGVRVDPDTDESSASYEVNDDTKTVLYENFKCYKTVGILNGAEGIALSEELIDNDRVIINNVVYRNSFENAYELIGYEVVAFVKEIKDGLHETIFIMDSGRNDITEINLKNLNPVGSDLTLNYYTDGSQKMRSLKLPANVSVIKNGEMINKDINKAFNSGQGRAVIINNGKNYVAKIFVYDSVLVGAVNKKDNTIYAKYGQSVKVEDSDLRRVKIVLADGSDGSIDSIESGMFLTVFRSKPCVEVYVSSFVTEGTAMAVYDKKLSIDDTEYSIEPNFITEAKKKIFAGSTGTFWFNIYGELAYFDVATGLNGAYGILVGAVPDVVFDTTLKLKIFTTEGKMLIAEAIDKPKVDGSKISAAQAYTAILNAGGGVASQVVTYKLNADGKLSEIDTVAPNPDGRGLAVRKSPDGTDTWSRIYDSSTNMMLPDVVMKKGAVMIQTPKFEDAASADDKKFKIITTLELQTEYDCIAYTSDADSFYTDLVVLEREDDLTTFSHLDQPFMVADVSDVMDEEGNIRKQLVLAGAISQSGGADMGLMTFMVSEDYVLTSGDVQTEPAADPYNQDPGVPVMPEAIDVGDMVRVIMNQDKEITKIKLLFDFDNPKDTMLNIKKKEKQKGGNGRFAAGYAVKKEDNYVALSTVAPGGNITEFAYFSGASNVPVIVFDEKLKENKVYVGSYNDVITFEETGKEASVVIPITYYGWPRSCFIYRYGR